MSIDRVEWVEIIEPKTKEHMYANLTTGECVWDPPVGVSVKKTDNNQWWELFDENTSRFYYYNATSQKTVWHRPQNSDIIPLAKLQTLKQNTEPLNDLTIDKKCRETVATQTPGRTNNQISKSTVTSIRPIRALDCSESSDLLIKTSAPRSSGVHCETQTSPVSPRRSHRHHHHHHHHHHHRSNSQSINQTNPPKKFQQSPWYTRNAYSQETGRSGDYNLEQLSSQTKSMESTGYTKKPPATETSSTPPSDPLKASLPHVQRSFSNASHHLNKQKSFDIDISVGGGYSLGYENRSSCPRSKPVIISSSLCTNSNPVNRSRSFLQQRTPASVTVDCSNLGLTDNEEEDSMHEKYFSPNVLSLHGKMITENTPTMNRRKHSEISSPTVDGGGSNVKANVPDYVNFISTPAVTLGTQTVSSITSRSSSSNSSTLASFSKHKLLSRESKSEEKFSSNEDIQNSSSSVSASSSPPTAATPPRKSHYSKSIHFASDEKNLDRNFLFSNNQTSSSFIHGCHSGDSNNIQNVEKRTSPFGDLKIPLYSNIKYSLGEKLAPVLPLDQYIREQAVLSGCYKFGDRVNDEGEELFQSEDDERFRIEYDSDEFADDEGMSNVEDEDSSSQEYLPDENPPFLSDALCSNSRQKQYASDGRVCDYVVDGFESRMALNPGHYCNVTPECATDDYQKTSCPINLVSTVDPSTKVRSNSPNVSIPSETQHTSLKRRKDLQQSPALYSPILERSERLVSIASQNAYFFRKDFTRRSDHAITYKDDMSCLNLNKEKKLPSDSDIEKYAQDNLNIHKKGIFRKKSSIRAMLSYSKDPIRKPMLVLSDKSLKKDACELFKLVQIYMGDRKTKIGLTSSNIALEICSMAYSKPALRDELFIQICRQTTDNPRKEGLRRGWELMAICLAFFPPSPKFQAYLESYMNRHRDPSFDFPEIAKWPIHVQISHYATVACKRLERVGVSGKRVPKKPTLDEIDQARVQILRTSMFGSTLDEIMSLQKERFPHYKLPWLQTTLSEQILRLQGTQTEGIFRVPADMDEVMALKAQLDRWEVPDEITDAHTPASLLKLWYRELYEPLIPDSMYEQCVTYHDDIDRVNTIVEQLPEINRLVLAYLINFLQMFLKPEIVQTTKMDASNLAMVMAPNCLRCTSDDPRVIFDNARKEMAFIRTLIQHMDTKFIEGIL